MRADPARYGPSAQGGAAGLRRSQPRVTLSDLPTRCWRMADHLFGALGPAVLGSGGLTTPFIEGYCAVLEATLAFRFCFVFPCLCRLELQLLFLLAQSTSRTKGRPPLG